MGRKSKAQLQGERFGNIVGFVMILFIIAFVISIALAAVFYIGGAIAIAMAIGIPLFLLLSIPHYLVKMNRIQVDAKNSISDYWFSRQEKEELKSLYQDWRDAIAEEERINNEIEQVHEYAAKQSITKNLDGSYSKRTEIGKSITNSLTNLEVQLDLAEDHSIDCWKEYNELASLPYCKWKIDSDKLKERDKLYRKIWGSVISFILMIFIIIIFYVTGYNKMIVVEYVYDLLNQFISLEWFTIGKETALELISHQYFEFLVLLLISSLISLIFYGVINAYSISKNNNFKYSVEEHSSSIDIDEIDDYERIV